MPATIRSSSDSGISASSGLTTNLPSILPMRTAPTWVGKGMSDTASAAEAPFIARMSYGLHVVDAHRRRDDLGLVAPALGEQRADRAVDHPRREDALLGGPALALEEAAGDLPRGVHALLDVDGQGQEVDVTHVAGGRGAEHHRLAHRHDHGAACLLGQLAGLEGQLGACDVDRGPASGGRGHSGPFRQPPVGCYFYRAPSGAGFVFSPELVAMLSMPFRPALGGNGVRSGRNR